MINPKKELLKWGPIDGRPVYMDGFVQAFVFCPEFWKVSWPDIFGYTKDDKSIFIADYEELRDAGEKLFKRFILDKNRRKERFRQWFECVKEIKKFESIVNKGLGKLSDKELKELFVSFDQAHMDFWVKGFLPELSNWGGERLLKNKILEFNKMDFIRIFEKLSAPEDLSFFQKEELEFMKIKLIKDGKERMKKLENHQKRYYWIRNSYGFTKMLSVDFFKKELEKISKKEAKEKIKEINNYKKNVKKEKQKIIKKYGINREIADIARNLSYTVWWQDFRKQFIFMANHIISVFLKEIEKRKKVPFKELCYYISSEIAELLTTNKKVEAKKRFKGFNTYYHENKHISYLTGEKASKFVKPYIDVEVNPNTKELSGLVVSMGNKVKGRIRVLLTPRNANKMKAKEVLVAPMTSPDYIIAMKKAAAVITDHGGMTSHAAIVSRELKIPCIVGTKIATKLFKDGDLVEVDAEKGVVRKMN